MAQLHTIGRHSKYIGVLNLLLVVDRTYIDTPLQTLLLLRQ
jgi:hypothetical protein